MEVPLYRRRVCAILQTKSTIFDSVLGQIICARGFPDITRPDSASRNQLIPLLGRKGRDVLEDEQWIFPTLEFTCKGKVAGWAFIGMKGTNFTTSCSVRITTWRRDASSDVTNAYRRLTTTEGNTRTISVRDSLFTYELKNPVTVRPGDILGIEKGIFCTLPQNFDNIMSLNMSEMDTTPSSFHRSSRGVLFSVDESSSSPESNLVPLAMPIIGEF